MILETKIVATVALVSVMAGVVVTTVQSAVQGVVVSPGMAVTLLVEFVALVFLGAKTLADGRASREFQRRMEDVPQTLARIDERLQDIEAYVTDQRADERDQRRRRGDPPRREDL